MRLPGAALLLTIGLLILWLSVTGNIKRLGNAWDYVRGNTQKLGDSNVASADPTATGIHDFSSYHVSTHLVQPDIAATIPGGIN